MRLRSLAPLLAVVSLVSLQDACRTTTDGASKVAGDETPGTPPAGGGDACSLACADTTTNEKWAVCWSCKCKAAMDGWLPSPAEISCAAGKELEIFRMEEAAGGVQLKKVTGPVETCLNPDRLRNHCDPGSRLVQVQKGDVVAKAICKREAPVESWQDPNTVFSETGIIIHNNRTGATCFYDDHDDVMAGNTQPDIDLTDGSPEKVEKFLAKYYRTEGEGCPACHDNDPFMYDPHLSTSGWLTTTDYTMGPYHLVNTRGEAPKSLHKHLVSDDAAACTSCHRISDGNTCQYWASDSMGEPGIDVMQEWMSRTNNKWGVKVEAGFKWSYPYWMPDHNYMRKTQQPPATLAAWDAKYKKAKEHIQKCCQNPGVSENGCQWEDIPATGE